MKPTKKKRNVNVTLSFAVLMLIRFSDTMHHERPPGPKPSAAPEHLLRTRLQTSGYWRSTDPPWKNETLSVNKSFTMPHPGQKSPRGTVYHHL